MEMIIATCPFCGTNDVSVDKTIDSYSAGSRFEWHEVYCEQCDYAGPGDYDERNAIARWNARIPL